MALDNRFFDYLMNVLEITIKFENIFHQNV